eukprot:2952579-Amphidinium_carterae.1
MQKHLGQVSWKSHRMIPLGLGSSGWSAEETKVNFDPNAFRARQSSHANRLAPNCANLQQCPYLQHRKYTGMMLSNTPARQLVFL